MKWTPLSRCYNSRYARGKPVACPTDDGIMILVQGLGNITALFTMRPHANDSLALFLRVLDLPIHPFAILGSRGDINHQYARLPDSGREDLILDVIFRMRIVGIVRPNRVVPDRHAVFLQQTLQFGKTRIIFMNGGLAFLSTLSWRSRPIWRGTRIIRGSFTKPFSRKEGRSMPERKYSGEPCGTIGRGPTPR